MSGNWAVAPARDADLADWLALRDQLWEGDPPEAHLQEIRDSRATGRFGAWLARDSEGRALGFAEATLRDFADGVPVGRPIAYLEGILVIEPARRRGIARALLAAVTDWARAAGADHMASDAVLDNADSHAWHAAMGFDEVDRVVTYARSLAPAG
ncbi:MAG: GNAT family N-acetyltransferase [Sphingomonadaceae bacterium]